MEEKNKNSQRGIFFGGVIAGLTGALIIVASVYLGNMIYMRFNAGNGKSSGTAITSKVVNKQKLLEKTIDQYFYLHDVTDEELANGIYSGMLNSLGDVYSEYFTAEELNEAREEIEGSYFGIGAYIGIDQETQLPKLTGIIEESPAEAAGLHANDLIYEVDGTSTQGMKISEVVSLIKGEENTEVLLNIIGEGGDFYEVSVTRGKVDTPTVKFEMLDDAMAYIQIIEFDEVTIDQFAEALAMAKGSGMKGLILDLRANPGGSLAAVTEIARMMLPEGLILYTEDKSGKRMEYTCDGKRQLEVPLVVLVDMNSASAAEVLAGAIKDHGIGTLVGTTTYGKGIVQQIIPLTDGSAVKMTVSGYFTPNGNNIHGTGIEPDIECKFDGEAYYREENPIDNQLEKAKEVLAEKMAE